MTVKVAVACKADLFIQQAIIHNYGKQVKGKIENAIMDMNEEYRNWAEKIKFYLSLAEKCEKSFDNYIKILNCKKNQMSVSKIEMPKEDRFAFSYA